MSVSLHWYKPPSARKSLGSSGYPLKGILADRYGNHDGSCHEEFTLNSDDIPFIEGLAAAGVDGAGKLLKDLRAHGSLECDLS